MVDSENITAIQCYNISADFQAVGICNLFGQSCDSVHLWTHLKKSNKNDPASITEETAEVVVEVPDQCQCSTPTQPQTSDRQTIVIAASVPSVVVTITIAAVIVFIIIFYYKKTRILVTKNNTEE